MQSVKIPKKRLGGFFEETIFDNISVIPSGPAVTSLIYSLDLSLVHSGDLWVKYNPCTPGNSLRVSLFFGPKDSALLLPSAKSPYQIDDSPEQGAVIPLPAPGCPDLQVLIRSSGSGPADAVTVILCGRVGRG